VLTDVTANEATTKATNKIVIVFLNFIYFSLILFFTSLNYIAKAVVYAVKRTLKRKLYNIDHKIILANGNELVVMSKVNLVFMKINIPIRIWATV